MNIFGVTGNFLIYIVLCGAWYR